MTTVPPTPEVPRVLHDLCNQIGAIQLRAEALLLTTDDTARRGHVAAIMTACHNALGITCALLPMPEAPPAHAADPGGGTLAGLHLLLVEDDPLLIDVMEELLRSRGARITAASTAETALQLLSGDIRFDLALIDLSMAAGIGGARLKQVLTGPRDLPVICMSGFRAPGFDLPANTVFLTKPVALSPLVSAIARLTRRTC